MTQTVPTLSTILIRYGAIPEVSRFAMEAETVPRRGTSVVVHTRRGLELGTVLEAVRPPREPGSPAAEPTGEVVRAATVEDQAQGESLRREARAEFPIWQQRISGWGLDLQLIDLEHTLDRARLILYVLNERGPECTKLALQAAAAGLGTVEVQPVSLDGPVSLPTGGGGCGNCGSH